MKEMEEDADLLEEIEEEKAKKKSEFCNSTINCNLYESPQYCMNCKYSKLFNSTGEKSVSIPQGNQGVEVKKENEIISTRKVDLEGKNKMPKYILQIQLPFEQMDDLAARNYANEELENLGIRPEEMNGVSLRRIEDRKPPISIQL